MKQFTFTYHSFKFKNGNHIEETTHKGRLFIQVNNIAEFICNRYNLDISTIEIIFKAGVIDNKCKLVIKFEK